MFINDYYNNAKDLKNIYKNNFDAFYKEFNVSDKDLSEFKKFVEKKDITWNENEFNLDKDYFKAVLKSLIANIIFDRNKQALILGDIDRQLQIAKTLFPEAEKIARMGQTRRKR